MTLSCCSIIAHNHGTDDDCGGGRAVAFRLVISVVVVVWYLRAHVISVVGRYVPHAVLNGREQRRSTSQSSGECGSRRLYYYRNIVCSSHINISGLVGFRLWV